MSIDGTWNLEVNSPMGTQKSTVTLAADGSKLTGTTTGPQGNTGEIKDGKLDGDAASWTIDITTPMPMSLTFEGTVSGDAMSGKVKAGAFGSFPFTGERA